MLLGGRCAFIDLRQTSIRLLLSFDTRAVPRDEVRRATLAAGSAVCCFSDRLREALTVDHADMPTFVFTRPDARAFGRYLRSIQRP
jgi:hypothetical protein